jgi:hypothetical protein
MKRKGIFKMISEGSMMEKKAPDSPKSPRSLKIIVIVGKGNHPKSYGMLRLLNYYNFTFVTFMIDFSCPGPNL